MDNNEATEVAQPVYSLRTENKDCWFFKPLENMQMHLAYLDQFYEPRIIFTNTLGHVFEEISLSDDKGAKSFLRTNGFQACLDNDEFMKLFGLPTTIEKYDWYQERVYQP